MLGHSHSTSGVLTWGAATAAAPVAWWSDLLSHQKLTPADIVLGTFATAGAALLPDLDHPDGSIAHFLGPVSHQFCRLVEKISGGHRHATHSFLFVALVTFGTWEGAHHWGRPFVLAMMYILLSLAVRALHLCPPGKGIHSWGVVVIIAAVGTFATYQYLPANPAWLPAAVGLGALTHLGGDCITKEGCPLFWPVKMRFEIPLIKRTGNKFETAFLTPLFAVAGIALLVMAVRNPR
ncbi:metal-dependent hydrolase [Actinospica robiniae]|uniref:metal-dependent hydrolase n=1 Tax=Actinospica robiniae TaxID=304901 RepID=UPI00040A1DBA|nr:metal-dependent hydrolase [Actinospica robiniae]